MLRHEQSTLAIQQLSLFAFHNGRPLYFGKPLELPPITPFPGLEGPFVYAIPDTLPLEEGGKISTTEGGQRPIGRLTLQTSNENMPRVYKSLKPRWKISYKTSEVDMIGSKPISDFASAMPGAQYVYGALELAALAPGYVEHGRRRPKPGPLVDAVDAFISERVRELAKKISEQRRRALDDKALDEVQIENQRLDEFKNKFLSTDGGEGGQGGSSGRPGRRTRTRTVEYGTVPDVIELVRSDEPLRVASGVELHAKHLLNASVLDAAGLPVRAVLTWHTGDPGVVRFSSGDTLVARGKGQTEIWASVKLGRGPERESAHVPVEVVVVDHVLLTPRKLEVPMGDRASVVAEVTDDEGRRHADILLKWRHDADDQLIVRIGPRGTITGTRLGKTAVMAGGAGPGGLEVWSRIPVEVEVVHNPKLDNPGGGFPQLKVTDRDIDPETGQIRLSDPDSPALWQEAPDYANNIWWLNLGSSEAFFAFSQRENDSALWRYFHASIVVELVVQVKMQTEYTRQGEKEGPNLWSFHRQMMDVNRVNAVQQMWEQLEPYIREGADLS